MHFRQIDFEKVRWDDIELSPDCNFFQTKAWIEFLSTTQKASPVIAVLEDDSTTLGYFVGLRVRRFCVPILASPMPGWTTPYIGFNLKPGVARCQALVALRTFAFHELGCWHLEIADPAITEEDARCAGFLATVKMSYATDLTLPEDALLHKLHKMIRGSLRKAQRSGVQIAEANDLAFADEYYDQLKDVFAKQGLIPTYPLERIRELIKRLLPTGRLLLLRALDPAGRCIATDICFGMGEVAFIFGNASYRTGQHLRPNQALHWYAFRYWKARGAKVFDWVGGSTYKEKYAAVPSFYVTCRASRVPLLEALRTTARWGYRMRQVVSGRLHLHPPNPECPENERPESSHEPEELVSH